jgi:hypothetical protein
MQYLLLVAGEYKPVTMDYVCGNAFVITMTEVCPRTGKVTIYLRDITVSDI